MITEKQGVKPIFYALLILNHVRLIQRPIYFYLLRSKIYLKPKGGN